MNFVVARAGVELRAAAALLRAGGGTGPVTLESFANASQDRRRRTDTHHTDSSAPVLPEHHGFPAPAGGLDLGGSR
jgi:hypothetical protein